MNPPIGRGAGEKLTAELAGATIETSLEHGSLASFPVEHSEFADEKHVEATIEKILSHGPIRMDANTNFYVIYTIVGVMKSMDYRHRSHENQDYPLQQDFVGPAFRTLSANTKEIMRMAINAKGYGIYPIVGASMKSMDYVDKSHANQDYPLQQDFDESVSRTVCAKLKEIMRSGFDRDFAAPGHFNHFPGPIAKSYVVCTEEIAGKFNLMDDFDLIVESPETYGELFAKSYVEVTKEVFMLSSRAGFVSIILPQEMYGMLIACAVGAGETGRRFSGGGFYPSVVRPEPFYSQYGVAIAKTLGATEIVTKFFGGSEQFSYNKLIPRSVVTGFIGYLSTDPRRGGGAHQPPPLPAPADEEVVISNLEVPFEPKVDSGASMNVTGEIRLLSEVRLVRPGQSVKIPDGRLLQTRAIGRIRRPGFDIRNVHLVDELTETLISVGQLARDHDICTIFRGSSCNLMLTNGSDRPTDWSLVGEADLGPNMQYLLRRLEIP